MGAAEIILLLIGIVLFIASFIIPQKKEISESESKFSEAQLKELAEKEMKLIQEKMESVVAETLDYAVEKTERALERLSNEKIMAINEYSDTVLKEINRNHEEVVFLYDMLNDKHTSLKNLVNEVTKTANEIKESVKDAEISILEFQKQEQKIQEEWKKIQECEAQLLERELKLAAIKESSKEEQKVVPKKSAPKKTAAKKPAVKKVENKTENKVEQSDVSIQFAPSNEGSVNNNEKILALHKTGKSNMAIAKELSLGLGEVKLVIDLFEGM